MDRKKKLKPQEDSTSSQVKVVPQNKVIDTIEDGRRVVYRPVEKPKPLVYTRVPRKPFPIDNLSEEPTQMFPTPAGRSVTPTFGLPPAPWLNDVPDALPLVGLRQMSTNIQDSPAIPIEQATPTLKAAVVQAEEDDDGPTLLQRENRRYLNEEVLPYKKMKQGGAIKDDWLDTYKEGGAISPEDAAISKVLMERNRGKNFVDRAFNNSTAPKLQTNKIPGYAHMPNSQYSTELMSYDVNPDGTGRVYPEIVQKPGDKGLTYLGGDKAYDYADSTGEYINTPTKHIADVLSNYGYKKAAGIPTYKDGGEIFGTHQAIVDGLRAMQQGPVSYPQPVQEHMQDNPLQYLTQQQQFQHNVQTSYRNSEAGLTDKSEDRINNWKSSWEPAGEFTGKLLEAGTIAEGAEQLAKLGTAGAKALLDKQASKSYIESNVAKHYPHSSIQMVPKEPMPDYGASWQNKAGQTAPLRPEMMPKLTGKLAKDPPLTKEQQILQSFNLDPYQNVGAGYSDMDDMTEAGKKKAWETPETNNPNVLNVRKELFQRLNTDEGRRRAMANYAPLDPNLKYMKMHEGPESFSNFYDRKPIVGIEEGLPEDMKAAATRHEVEHALQAGRPSAIDISLRNLELRSDIPEPGPRPIEDHFRPPTTKDFLNRDPEALKYFKEGSQGKEKSAYLGELQQYMVDNGYASHQYATKEITPDLVKTMYHDNQSHGDYPMRIFNIMKPNENNFKLISENLNKMLGVVPPAAVGAAAVKSNWLDNYKDTNDGK